MNFKELFDTQKKLDNTIVDTRGVENEDLFSKKVTAFIVEMGECANESRHFKYWSSKGPSQKEVILEEYIDAIHFALSLGNDLNLDLSHYNYIPTINNDSFEEKFLDITNGVVVVKVLRDGFKRTDWTDEALKEAASKMYIRMFENLLGYGIALGFTEDDIRKAYYEKNKINFKRQEEGY